MPSKVPAANHCSMVSATVRGDPTKGELRNSLADWATWRSVRFSVLARSMILAAPVRPPFSARCATSGKGASRSCTPKS